MCRFVYQYWQSNKTLGKYSEDFVAESLVAAPQSLWIAWKSSMCSGVKGRRQKQWVEYVREDLQFAELSIT